MAEALGVVDPRLLYEEMDSELVALWLAYFSIKNQAINGDRSPSQHTFINEPDLDQQVSACERLLL